MPKFVYSVGILGRANVGKSTLFNALTRSTLALVDDQPGVTRDYLREFVPEEQGLDSFYLYDSAGFEPGMELDKSTDEPLSQAKIWAQSKRVVELSDYILFVVDASFGVHPYDKKLIDIVRRSDKPYTIVLNKMDSKQAENNKFDFFDLAPKHQLEICASHRRGLGNLRQHLNERFEELSLEAKPHTKVNIEEACKIAIVGRPNAGKSSITNRLLGDERSMVSEVAGTTRDSIKAKYKYDGKTYEILDTAGMRKRPKIKERVEIFSSIKAFENIKTADVILLVLDVNLGLCEQDQRILRFGAEAGKMLIILVNKWDLLEDKDSKTSSEWEKDVRAKLGRHAHFPMMFTSALTGKRIQDIKAKVAKLYEIALRRIPTAEVNRTLEAIIQRQTPALQKGVNKRAKFYYATQVREKPPTFVIKCNVEGLIQESYKRFLANEFRKVLQLGPVMPKLIFRDKKSSEAQH
jgi:GTP-binding protein